MRHIVVINGSPRADSKTGIVLARLAESVSQRISSIRSCVNLSNAQRPVTSFLTRAALPESLERVLLEVESADLLIIGSPVYRASYTGLLKHFFDLLEREAMRGRVALLAASGGSPLHGLMLDHQLRPMVAFFGMASVPTAIYALPEDFQKGQIINGKLLERIDRAADEACALLQAREAPYPIAFSKGAAGEASKDLAAGGP